MATYIALLRGINVGRAKRIAMADLRTLFEDLGFENVRTLLNSGNVVFETARTTKAKLISQIEPAVARATGIDSRVTLITAGELQRIIEENELERVVTNDSRLYVAYFRNAADARLLEPLAKQNWKPERLHLGTLAAYLWLAEGFTESPLDKAATRVLRDRVTMRNWATTKKLAALTVS
jgi:uncharacterized protein (DUF1697 family)